jgi:hypothetical protein
MHTWLYESGIHIEWGGHRAGQVERRHRRVDVHVVSHPAEREADIGPIPLHSGISGAYPPTCQKSAKQIANYRAL